MPASQVNKAGERVETAAPMGGVVRTGMWAFVGKVGVRDEFVFMRKGLEFEQKELLQLMGLALAVGLLLALCFLSGPWVLPHP